MVVLLLSQVVVQTVSSITGIWVDYVTAGSVYWWILVILAGAIFHSKEDSTVLRWLFIELLVHSVMMFFYMVIASIGWILQKDAMPVTSLFALQSSLLVTSLLWLGRQKLRQYMEPEKETNAKE
jgi:hypothetical protein